MTPLNYQGQPLVIGGVSVMIDENGWIWYTAKLAVDSDGTGPHHGDRTAQNQTSLKLNGQFLNADEDLYIVVPPQIIKAVAPIVLGSQVHAWNEHNGKESDAVVGDEGPRSKLGEGSTSFTSAMGLDPSPVDGGTDDHIIKVCIKPGVPALVNGKQYQLQPS